MRNSKTTRTKLSHLKEYLISYCLILILPVMVFTFYTSNQTQELLSDHFFSITEKAANEAVNSLDDFGERLVRLQTHMSRNNILSPQMNLADTARSVQIIKELERYCLSEYGIDAISIHFSNDQYIYESSSSYPLDIYLRKLHRDSGISEDELRSCFMCSDNICYISGTNTNDSPRPMVYIFMPLYYESKSSGVIQISISQQMLYDIISPALASVDSTAAVWFDDRLLLTSADSVFDLDIWEDARAYLSNNPNTTLFHVDDSDCIVLSYESPASYLRCMTITPNADYVRLSQRSSQRLLLLLVIVIVCCGVLIAFLITRQYRPISSLMTMATSISPKNPHTRLENVYDTFSELVTINQHLESRNKEYTENRLIYSLLRGVSIDDPQQKSMLLSFEGSFYITLLVSTPRLNDRSPLLDRIREIFRDHFRVMVYLPAISDDVIVLLSYRNNDEESFRNAIKQIHENLTRTLKTDITFGVGNPVENISDIPQSYSDAAYALESILIKGKGSVVYINDLDDQDDYHRLFPYREADILHSYILSGDTAEATKILQNILDFIRNSRFSMTVAHRICADIYNRTLRTLEYSYTNNEAVVPSIPQFGRLSDYSSSEELVDAMTRLFDGLLQSLSNKKKQSEQTRGESMRDYIRNNCLSMDFSLQHMADDFGMAMTNLCHYYRSAFNQTILDYATEYRIEKACMLLQESNLSIVEISERVGYATPSGFIRRFKQVKGITPGKYNQSISKYAPNEE